MMVRYKMVKEKDRENIIALKINQVIKELGRMDLNMVEGY